MGSSGHGPHTGASSAREVMAAYATAVRAHRFDDAIALFAEDVVAHVPGRSPTAGEKRGKAQVEGYLRSVLAVAPDDIRVELLDALVGEEHFALYVHERIGGAHPFELLRLNLYRVRDGRICDIRIFEGDQYAADEHLERAVPR